MQLKKVIAGLAISTTFSVGLVTQSVSAATYECDNDPASYYNCYVKDYGFEYRSAGYNGDSRIAWASWSERSYSYTFNYSGIKAPIDVYIYLADSQFTNTYAVYYANSVGMKPFDQRNAPNGWNYLMTRDTNYNYEPYLVVWHNFEGRGNGNTGTDGIRFFSPGVYFKNSSNSDRTYHKNLEIASLQKKMLNAVDYYTDISGSFHSFSILDNQEKNVTFSVSQRNTTGSYVKTKMKNGNIFEDKSDGKSLVGLNHGKKSFTKSEVSQVNQSLLAGPRHFKNEKNEPVYIYRHDPAQAHSANVVTFPQQYAFWLSNSDAKVVGYEKLFGRNISIIEGKHDSYMSKKLKATTYKMWIDTKSGVLLKLEGKDQNGKIAYFTKVTDIKFNQGVDKAEFVVNEPKGWKNVSMSR